MDYAVLTNAIVAGITQGVQQEPEPALAQQPVTHTLIPAAEPSKYNGNMSDYQVFRQSLVL